MLAIYYSKQSYKFLSKLTKKHNEQIKWKLRELIENPKPNDCKQMRGQTKKFYRITCGEYRIVYRYDKDSLFIVVIGKRNDGEVYKVFARKI